MRGELVKGFEEIPPCPICGGYPTIYQYYEDGEFPRKITALICGSCRAGPDYRINKGPIETWIDYATKRRPNKL